MKKIFFLVLILVPGYAWPQSKTTGNLQDKYKDSFALFFYNNTLEMLNQTDSKEFTELVRDIDKMKFLRIGRSENKIDNKAIAGLVKDYHEEDFEDLMTMRHEGMNVNVYIQEEKGVTSGLVILMTDNESLSVLDIKGSVPLNKLASLLSQMDKAEGFSFD